MVPDYQSMMLPILIFTGDGKEHFTKETVESIAQHFKLTGDDRNELLLSGTQPKLNNRVAWSRFYLLRAGLLNAPARGRIKITQRGRDVLQSNPAEINTRFLDQYPEFVAFRTRDRSEDALLDAHTPPAKSSQLELPKQTPQEIIAEQYQVLRQQLAQELLDQIGAFSPQFFEKFVLKLLVRMGYGGSEEDAQAVGRSGDGGIDGIIKADALGLDAIYVQAKRWKATETVGRPGIQEFVGSLEFHHARKGVFITTSRFSLDAREYVKHIERKVILIDGQTFADYCIKFGIGVAEDIDYPPFIIKRLDLDYFEED